MIWLLYWMLACAVMLGGWAFLGHLSDRRYEREVQDLIDAGLVSFEDWEQR